MLRGKRPRERVKDVGDWEALRGKAREPSTFSFGPFFRDKMINFPFSRQSRNSVNLSVTFLRSSPGRLVTGSQLAINRV